MPYEVTADKDNQIIITRISGPAEMKEHLAAREEALQQCCDSQFKRILVDLRDLKTEDIITSESAFNFGRETANDERMKGVRIAHVMPKDVLARLDVNFVGTSSQIQGKTIGEFSTFDEAKEWLLAHNTQ